MDRQSAYSLSIFHEDRSVNGQDSRGRVHQQLVDFILDFHIDNVFVYR